MNVLNKKILVLGVGNILLSDDGLGPLVVRELEEFYPNPNITYLDGGTMGLDLLGYLEGYNCLLIIDALDLGHEPGSVFCWEGKTLKGMSQNVSFHQVGVKELLHAVNLLGLELEIIVMGIQVKEISWGMNLSEPVREAIPYLKEAVIRRINHCLGLNKNIN